MIISKIIYKVCWSILSMEDGFFGTCEKCNKKAVISVNAGKTNLCAYHYIKQENISCLKALIKTDILEDNKITLCKEIQNEIKKQRPKIYDNFEDYFSI